MAKHKKKQQLTLPGLLFLIVFLGLSFLYNSLVNPKQETVSPGEIPAYSGSAYVTVNNNVPFFTESDYTTTSYESYSPLDELGRCGVAEEPETGRVVGLYILHPNNVGRCGHIADASHAVAGNARARRLYERLGFQQLGVIPGGFLTKDGRYVDICPYYKELL